ncbi:hypothetical protein [Herpetosiphon llansteffanensis]|uniref:hypothetical protein n=1 Tax=Herpetosiphon llansteffanensis TaxID=2094568 RepID=UPI000F519EDC|nr:hypothetical protein [Herpetosiphon llansteffanensis]
MQPKYQVPTNRPPYRWRMIIRMVVAVIGGCFPVIMVILFQLPEYVEHRTLGSTFQRYVRFTPEFWTVFPLSIALVCLLIGISRDGWLLFKRRGTPTMLPISYRLSLLFVVIAFILYVRTIRIP